MANPSNESGPVARFARQASLAWKAFMERRHGCGPVGGVTAPPVDLLLCFAVKEEMKYFGARLCQVWMTGIGRKNAAINVRDAIARVRPERVITAGFAGGLNPALKCGTVIFDQDFDAGFGEDLEALGAVPAKFHCHRRVAITA